jgi:hypothetical protein
MTGDSLNFAQSAEQNGTVPLSDVISLHALKHIRCALPNRFVPAEQNIRQGAENVGWGMRREVIFAGWPISYHES